MQFNNSILRSFCEGKERRPVTCSPWSVGDHSYATNGSIIVRVARCEDVALADDNKKTAAMVDGWLAAMAEVERVPLPRFEIANGKRWACDDCEGRGYKHDCPDCSCDCDKCNGGYCHQRVIVAWHGLQIKALHWQLIAALPSSLIATALSPPGHIAFSFDGGYGLVMPMRVPLDSDEPPLIVEPPPAF